MFVTEEGGGIFKYQVFLEADNISFLSLITVFMSMRLVDHSSLYTVNVDLFI